MRDALARRDHRPDRAGRASPPGTLGGVRIARFVHSGSASVAAGMLWGAVEGPPDAPFDALTVAAVDGHPFGPITFTGDRWALPDVRLVAPILPSKVVAVGKNYADHAKEMAEHGHSEAAPLDPVIFLKPSTAVIGPGDAIRLPVSDRVDHEAELAIVIGAPARDVTRANALSHVFGYTCANDVTARDQQKADVQFTRGKGHDSFCPIGPWIETELDPSDLRVTASVNGEIRQDGRTSAMLHDVAMLIEFMSGVMSLLPGDVILTGTPAGVGPIVDGDTVTIEIEGIGSLTNPVRRRTADSASLRGSATPPTRSGSESSE
jgi:2-keto-4-pentenoate hydratase/2-oxohepta-3-ene-1,7-dioic acid hydratase in catechol pathway